MGTRFDMTIIQMLCAVFPAPEREMKAQFMQECSLSVFLPKNLQWDLVWTLKAGTSYEQG